MRVGIRILVLSLMLVFCSALMNNSLFISNAYAQANRSGGGEESGTVRETPVEEKKPDAANIGSSGSGWDVGGSECSQYKSNPFQLIACKAATTLDDLRLIVYIIAGFGLIAFAFAAIFGKISFKHLSQIAIGLFLVSMTAPFIEYFVGNRGYKLAFGDHLPAGNFSNDKMYFGAKNDVTKGDCGQSSRGYNNNNYYYAECKEETVTSDLEQDPLAANEIKESSTGGGSSGSGSSGGSEASASTSAPSGDKSIAQEGGATLQEGDATLADLASDTATTEEKEKTKKSLRDSVNDIISVVKAGSNAVGAAKQTIKDVGFQSENVIDAIKNNEGGLGGAIDIVNTAANAGAAVTDSTYRLNRNLEYNVGTVANGVQDLRSSNEQRAVNQTARSSGQATNAVGRAIQSQDYGDVTGGLNSARNSAYQQQQAMSGASNDANSMANVFGGDTALGQTVGIGTLAGAGAGSLMEPGTEADATAAARAAASGSGASDSGVYSETADRDGNRRLVYRDGTVQEIAVDGSQKVTYPDGTVTQYDRTGRVVKSTPGGVKTVEFNDGRMIYKDAAGKVIGEAAYNQNAVPSGAVRAEVNSNGSLVFYDADNNVVK